MMQSYAERLASFEVSHPAGKKRTSSAKNAKTLRWPHKTPAPAQLAEAGLIFRPTASAPDNATCFLCQVNLDGWELDDDPAAEHLKLSPSCGWAINVCIERNPEVYIDEDDAPTSEKMTEARKLTFASAWPHESKKGWLCKTQKMAEAGWYYCPTDESDDFVKCPYCNLSLDGWEPKDNPYDEHQRRSEDCIFFSQPAPKAKSGRGRKARASKASRMSTQSNLAAAMESVSIGDPGGSIDESVMMVEQDSVIPAKTNKGGKKITRAKKATAKPKGKAAKAGVEESMQASSFIEPEDDDFQVKIAKEPAQATRGKKRKSEDVHEHTEGTGSVTKKESIPKPPAKRRATRSRASTVEPESISMPLAREQDSDLHMTDGESMLPPPAPAPKRGGKSGRKRGSSTVRKASATSTASMASLRAPIPNDAEIEAALEADLDRPLTDDEIGSPPQPILSTKTRRLTRTKPASKQATASTAPTRRTTRTSTLPGHMTQPGTELEINAEQDLKHSSPPQQSRAPKSRKASKKHAGLNSVEVNRAQEPHHVPVEEPDVNISQGAQSKTTKPRQTSRQVATHNNRTSAVLDAPTVEYPNLDLNSSALGSRATGDDSGHETDASGLNQTTKKRGPKKGSKKTKATKKTGLMSRNIEDIVQPVVDLEMPDQPKSDAMVVNEPEAIDNQMVKVAAPAKETKKKITKQAKTKTTNAKPVVPNSPSPAPMADEPWTDGILGESTPLPSAVPRIPTPSPTQSAHAQTPATTNKAAETSPKASTPQRTPRPVVSPQSSDAENHPPSSRPSAIRPPLEIQSPSKAQTVRIPLAASTPTASPSKRNISKLQTSMPWTAVDIEKIFLASPDANKENLNAALSGALTSPEKKLTVEEWIYQNARKGEEQLRNECERLVGRFEGEGVRALKSLEGIRCLE